MKKSIFILAALIAVGFTSCKKDRVCECTTTNSVTTDKDVDTKTILKASKSQAKANCASTKWDEKAGSITITYTRNCELK